MNNTNEELEIDLLQLIQALWRKAWLIILVTAIFGVVTLAGTLLFVKPTYKAQAMLYVNSSNISVGNTKLSISSSELSAAKTLVDTYIVILNTRTTMEEVIQQAGVDYTYEQIKGMIDASAVNDTEIFSIDVISTSPQEAELIANTIARILPERIGAIVEGTSARIVDYAVVPAEKHGPSLGKNAVIGALLGFVLICGIIVVMELLDEQIHDSDYLSQTYDIPVLAVIPDLLSAGNTNDYYQSVEQRMKKRGAEK